MTLFTNFFRVLPLRTLSISFRANRYLPLSDRERHYYSPGSLSPHHTFLRIAGSSLAPGPPHDFTFLEVDPVYGSMPFFYSVIFSPPFPAFLFSGLAFMWVRVLLPCTVVCSLQCKTSFNSNAVSPLVPHHRGFFPFLSPSCAGTSSLPSCVPPTECMTCCDAFPFDKRAEKLFLCRFYLTYAAAP